MRKRPKILLWAAIFLAAWLIFWEILPIGSGNWNEKQIEKINSKQSNNSFCFAVMGDNKNGFGTFNKIIERINQEKPLFAIDIGDLVYDGAKDKYRIFYNEIKQSNLPFLVAVGNHDVGDNGRIRYYNIFGDFYYSFSYNDSLFVVLDDANEKDIDRQQMNFLESELKQGYKHKFVFLHVPPFDPREYITSILGKNIKAEHSLSDKENARQFMELVSNYNVTTVFTSHIHGYFNETSNGVPYIITGGAGGEMLLSDPEHYFFHYVNICVNNDSITYNIVKLPSPGANSIDRLGYAAWLYVWYFIVIYKYIIILFILIFALILDFFYPKIQMIN